MSKNYLLSFFILAFSLNGYAQTPERKLYVGANSTEAIIKFEGAIQYTFASKNPREKTIRTAIESQLDHIVGPMSFALYTSVPKGDHDVTNIKVLDQKGTTMNISYHYKGTAVVQNGPKSTYDIILPVNPATIYKKSMVGNFNPCTDDHYQGEGDFWYFWNPDRPGCNLVKDKDYFIIKAKLTRFTNSVLSYPEYHNLPDSKGNITIHILFGMDDTSESRNALTSRDINAANYKQFRYYLVKKGYTVKTWTAKEVKSIAKTYDDDGLPFVETLQKGKIVYRFFFGPTGIDETSTAFHWFYKDAIENASIMLYGGHSGLGGHLDLEAIENNLGETINFNTKKYQIFFFDSCTSYRYYNDMYFDRKKTSKDPNGTKKLDIITNGLATTFDSMQNSNAALATALEKSLEYAERGTNFVSYQSLAKQIDSENLFGINGDEDNEAPKKIK